MHGWDRIASACGLGCKVFWSPWAQDDKYNTVNKDETEPWDASEPVTSEPTKPIWSDLHMNTPIVKNKSGSLGNIRTGPSYERLSVGNLGSSSSTTRLNDKRNSKPDLNGSVPQATRVLLKTEQEELTGSRTSLADEKLHVTELVTTV